MLRRVLSAVAFFALVAGPAGAHPAPQPSHSPASAGVDDPEVLSILVIGDSYSAGNGAGGTYYAGECHRSSNNYGRVFQRLVEKHRPQQKVFVETRACSGATTNDYWSTQNADAGSPQRDWVNEGYDVVMMTFGGNDLGFLNVVTSCLMREFDDKELCESHLSYAEDKLIDRSFEVDLTVVLSDVLSRTASDTKVVLLGYPYLERNENLTFGDIDLGARLKRLADDGSHLQSRVVADLNEAYDDRLVYVSPRALFSGRERWLQDADRGLRHELGKGDDSPDRWVVQPFSDASAFQIANMYHPNEKGWRREGELLFRDTRIPISDVPDPVTIRPGGFGRFSVGVAGQILADVGYVRRLDYTTPCAGNWASPPEVDGKGLWISAAAGHPDDVDLFQAWSGNGARRYPIRTREGAKLGTGPKKLRALYQRELSWKTSRVDGGWRGGYLMFGTDGALFFSMAQKHRPPKPTDAGPITSIEAYPGARGAPDQIPLWMGAC